MSKVEGRLSYKDWCILKHTLDRSIRDKKETLFMDTLVSANNIPFEKRLSIEKELEEEKQTFERITELTNKFKNYIKGGRHY